MKNLLNLGKALNKAQQKTINGGRRFHINPLPECHNNNSFVEPECLNASDCSFDQYCHLTCGKCINP